jgi:hypothetical protein
VARRLPIWRHQFSGCSLGVEVPFRLPEAFRAA